MQATSISSSKADYIDIYLSRLVKLTHPKEQRSASNNRLHIRGGAIQHMKNVCNQIELMNKGFRWPEKEKSH